MTGIIAKMDTGDSARDSVKAPGMSPGTPIMLVDDDNPAERRRYWGPVRPRCVHGLGDELACQAAQRASGLAAVNEELRREIAEHRRVAAALRKEIGELQRCAADGAAMLAVSQQLGQTGSFSWHLASGRITCSEQARRIYGYEQSMPMTLGMIAARAHPEDLPVLQDIIERAQFDGRGFECEHRLSMPDCSVKYVHIVALAARDDEGHRRYIGAVRDITESHRSEQALGNIRTELARVARVTTLGVLAAAIAHEVAQPLSGIVTNASTCLHMLESPSPNLDEMREPARRIIRDCHRASEVVTRLRALIAGRGPTTAIVDVNAAAREVIALTSGELLNRGVRLRPHLADDLPPVTGDCVQIEQVILNLILNAADAMSAVADRPRQLVLTTKRDEDDRVTLAVQDTGGGFPPESAERLFEAFYTTKRGGMGIGLSVSRTIIESHGGTLSARLNDGPGATFWFSIPPAA